MRLSAEVLSLAEQRPNALGEREIVLRGLGIPVIEHLAVTRDAFDTLHAYQWQPCIHIVSQ